MDDTLIATKMRGFQVTFLPLDKQRLLEATYHFNFVTYNRTLGDHESLTKAQEGHLHKRLEMLPLVAPSFPNTLMSTTPVKARMAEPHVVLLT